MPEGPEIRRAADRIADAVVGHELVRVFFGFDRLAHFEELLRGEHVTAVDTHGKAMLTRLSGGLTLYSHNQLYGRWYVQKPGTLPDTNRNLRVGLHTRHRDALLYSASDVDVLGPDELALHPFLQKLGPDVLWPDLGWREIDERLRSRTFRGRQLAALLLDQGFVAGLGNYLRSEILFAARLDPWRRPQDLGRAERHRLARRVLSLSRRSYRTGGITVAAGLARELRARGQPRAQMRHYVFARARRACRECGTRVERGEVGSRRIYWCPTCQV